MIYCIYKYHYIYILRYSNIYVNMFVKLFTNFFYNLIYITKTNCSIVDTLLFMGFMKTQRKNFFIETEDFIEYF